MKHQLLSVSIMLAWHFPAMAQQPDLPPLPPSMVMTLTEAVGHIGIDEIYFESGSHTLNAQDQQRLGELASKLVDLPVYIIIEAFTDARGSAAYNKDLSQRRAASCGRIFRDKGFASTRLIEAAYGESRSADEVAAESAQRRVQFTVLRRRDEPMQREALIGRIRERGVDLSLYAAPEPQPESVEPVAPVKTPNSDVRWDVDLRLMAGRIGGVTDVKGLGPATGFAFGLGLNRLEWGRPVAHVGTWSAGGHAGSSVKVAFALAGGEFTIYQKSIFESFWGGGGAFASVTASGPVAGEAAILELGAEEQSVTGAARGWSGIRLRHPVLGFSAVATVFVEVSPAYQAGGCTVGWLQTF